MSKILKVKDIAKQYGVSSKSVMEELAGMLGKEEMPCVNVYEHFKAKGISARTVENAKQELGVKSVKRGGAWYRQR